MQKVTPRGDLPRLKATQGPFLKSCKDALTFMTFVPITAYILAMPKIRVITPRHTSSVHTKEGNISYIRLNTSCVNFTSSFFS